MLVTAVNRWSQLTDLLSVFRIKKEKKKKEIGKLGRDMYRAVKLGTTLEQKEQKRTHFTYKSTCCTTNYTRQP